MRPEYISAVFLGAEEIAWPAEFCIVTACNPYGKAASDEENRRRNEQLRHDLDLRQIWHAPIVGASPDETYQEASFAIAAGRDAGLELARKYQQEAIYQVRGDRLLLVSCHTGEEVDLGTFRSRLRRATKASEGTG